MIRLDWFTIFRSLLLACVLGAGMSGCASDGRLDLKKLDFSKLQQPAWMRWDKSRSAPPPPVAPSQHADATAAASAAPVPALASARPTGAVHSQPRPKPGRYFVTAPANNPFPAARKPHVSEAKEQPAKAPQGKVTSETPKALAVLPPAGKSPDKPGKGGYTPHDLVGLDVASVERLLGKPDMSRKEPFAEVWQYAHGDCVLFVFLYVQDKGATRVSHAETGARDGDKNLDPGQCVGAILSRNSSSPG